jgi:hypothetical protein
VTENQRLKPKRDSELLKIQILADYFQASFNFLASILAGFFVGFLVFGATLRYQNILDNITFPTFLVIVLVAFLGYSKWIIRGHHSNLEKIDNLFTQLQKGEPLLSITEILRQMHVKNTKKRKTEPAIN